LRYCNTTRYKKNTQANAVAIKKKKKEKRKRKKEGKGIPKNGQGKRKYPKSLLGRTNKVKTPTIAPYPPKKTKEKAYAQHITTMILRINLEGEPLETLKHGQNFQQVYTIIQILPSPPRSAPGPFTFILYKSQTT